MQCRSWVGLCLVLLALLVSAGCTSPHMSSELQAGKVAFESNDYFLAFRTLLPVARAGRPEAEYAIGYMYYYGLGVTQDTSSGLMWIERAAAQHYAPAFEALDRIHHEDMQRGQKARLPRTYPVKATPVYPDQAMTRILPEATHSLSAPSNKKHPTIAQLQPRTPASPSDLNRPIRPAPLTKPEPMKKIRPILQPIRQPVPVKKPIPNTLRVPNKVVSVGKRHYTLQFYGSYYLADVKSLRDRLGLAKNASAKIYHTKHLGRDWYVLALGDFHSATSASQHKETLAVGLKEFHPWIRDADGLMRV